MCQEGGGDMATLCRMPGELQRRKEGDTLKKVAASCHMNAEVEAPSATHEGGGDFVSHP